MSVNIMYIYISMHEFQFIKSVALKIEKLDRPVSLCNLYLRSTTVLFLSYTMSKCISLLLCYYYISSV